MSVLPFIASRLSGLTQCPADPLKISFVCGNSCCYALATASLAMRIIQVKIFHRLWKQHPVCNALCAPVCVCVIKWSVRNTHTLALLKLELYANTDTHAHATHESCLAEQRVQLNEDTLSSEFHFFRLTYKNEKQIRIYCNKTC